ncbi:Hpt domain-containing protein, partial [Vibrio genomosp. F10 str. 9ZC157]|uniref:Hpt domain-containing protein n=1 Tax=Vibrio genomosp. F10 TaxID=723171 RepID=UPI0003789D72
MSYDLDEDILQDFLVEAGEILELLSEQLVELENNPDDKELLNAIFRGFHTVKGGAGFLALTELVDTCHGAENVFDILRNGQRSVTSGLMDTMLRALDTVNEQFRAVQDSTPLPAADQGLLDELHRLCKPESEDEVVEEAVHVEEAPQPVVETVPEPVASAPEAVTSSNSVDDITQDEFEKLLDELHGKGTAPNSVESSAPAAPAAPASSSEASGDITDDEFEKLLDELHGSGKSPQASSSVSAPEPPASSAPAAKPPAAQGGDDLMSDEEFEKLLDDLHGAGNGPAPDELADRKSG